MRTILLTGMLSGMAIGQSLSTDPPPIVQIVRKPGTVGASMRPYAGAQAAVNAIGISG